MDPYEVMANNGDDVVSNSDQLLHSWVFWEGVIQDLAVLIETPLLSSSLRVQDSAAAVESLSVAASAYVSDTALLTEVVDVLHMIFATDSIQLSEGSIGVAAQLLVSDETAIHELMSELVGLSVSEAVAILDVAIANVLLFIYLRSRYHTQIVLRSEISFTKKIKSHFHKTASMQSIVDPEGEEL